jgi:hypothetical protein
METKFIFVVTQALYEIEGIVKNIDKNISNEIINILKYLKKPNEEHPLGKTLREIISLTDEKGTIDKLVKNTSSIPKVQELEELRVKIFKTAYHIITTPSAEELKMESELKNIAEIIKGYVTNEEYSQICEYIDHDEWGLALENICAAIRDEKIMITSAIYYLIDKLGMKMEMDKEIWHETKPFIKK